VFTVHCSQFTVKGSRLKVKGSRLKVKGSGLIPPLESLEARMREGLKPENHSSRKHEKLVCIFSCFQTFACPVEFENYSTGVLS
jgi:hypothetical protein